jgi:general secretion pathway protein I
MKARRGFTLLEVLVATTLMAIAITGLLGALRVSLTNASRLTETDRAAALARRPLDDSFAGRVSPGDLRRRAGRLARGGDAV